MGNTFWYSLIDIFMAHKGKIIGTFLGLLVGILILLIGFFKTLLILIFTFLGYYLGSIWDLNEDLKSFLIRLLPPKLRP